MKYEVSLSKEEDKFLNHTLRDICSKANDYQIMKTQNIQGNMDRLKKSGIFGMLIPSGGGEQILYSRTFSNSQKLSSRSGSLGVIPMVPNS